jgi:hypothetical protein
VGGGCCAELLDELAGIGCLLDLKVHDCWLNFLAGPCFFAALAARTGWKRLRAGLEGLL